MTPTEVTQHIMPHVTPKVTPTDSLSYSRPNQWFMWMCVPTRIALVIWAWKRPNRVLSGLLGIMSIGIYAIYRNGWRKVGWETQGEPIWWNGLRPVHAFLWGLSALLGWSPRYRQWMAVPLLVDTLLGMIMQHVYRNATSSDN